MNTSLTKTSNPVSGDAPEAPPPTELVNRARQGDQEAFGELVKMYHARLYGVVYSMVNHTADAQEVTQQAWVKAWNKLHTFKADAGFFTWLYRIAANTALDFLRSRARRQEDSLSAHADEDKQVEADLPAGDQWRPDRQIEKDEVHSRFEKALDKLTPEHRSALVLREVEGMSYKDIARIMKCRAGTVMSRIFYARKCIQQDMKDLL